MAIVKCTFKVFSCAYITVKKVFELFLLEILIQFCYFLRMFWSSVRLSSNIVRIAVLFHLCVWPVAFQIPDQGQAFLITHKFRFITAHLFANIGTVCAQDLLD